MYLVPSFIYGSADMTLVEKNYVQIVLMFFVLMIYYNLSLYYVPLPSASRAVAGATQIKKTTIEEDGNGNWGTTP